MASLTASSATTINYLSLNSGLKWVGVKMKMSATYHHETDSLSEWSNKTINQMLRYHVQWNQKGRVCALSWIWFQIMNSKNASTGYSSFQLHLGHSPRIIPPIVPSSLPNFLNNATATAKSIITCVHDDVSDMCTNLLLTKITQSHHMLSSHGCSPKYKIGNMVMLSATNCCHKYKWKGEKWTAKFFPQWDSPWKHMLTCQIIPSTSPPMHIQSFTLHCSNHISQM